MVVKTPTKAIGALQALKALQEDAKRKGLDKMTIEEINSEIAAFRREKRVKKDRAKRLANGPGSSRYQCCRAGLPDTAMCSCDHR
jgi:hypothetical protein